MAILLEVLPNNLGPISPKNKKITIPIRIPEKSTPLKRLINATANLIKYRKLCSMRLILIYKRTCKTEIRIKRKVTKKVTLKISFSKPRLVKLVVKLDPKVLPKPVPLDCIKIKPIKVIVISICKTNKMAIADIRLYLTRINESKLPDKQSFSRLPDKPMKEGSQDRKN